MTEAHDTLQSKLKPTYADPKKYFIARLFISYVASFEIFIQETMSVVLQRHPKKLGTIEFRLSEILDAGGPEELVRSAIEQTQVKLMYKKPLDYLAELSALLSIPVEDVRDDWKVFVEAKARRDLGVHNAWKCNAVYARKLHEAGLVSALAAGDSALPPDDSYLDKVYESLDRLSQTLTRKVVIVHWPELLQILDAASQDAPSN